MLNQFSQPHEMKVTSNKVRVDSNDLPALFIYAITETQTIGLYHCEGVIMPTYIHTKG